MSAAYACILGSRLRAARQARGLSPGDVAEFVGITAPYLTCIERGGAPDVAFVVMVRLARAINVPLDTLVEGIVF